MMMNLLVIAMIGAIGYIWASRGFFSALLHFACVLASGAIALSVWEPLAYMALGQVDTQWIIDMIWGASLLVPFVLCTAILTSGMNALVRANAQCDGITNIIGGGVCGLGTAIITSGILVMSLGMVRSRPDFLDYQAVAYDGQGSVVQADSLWIPVDKLTAGAYLMMSEGTLASGEPLAKWRPRLALDGHLLRLGPNDNTLKYTLRPKDVGFLGRYLVGNGQQPVPFRDLVGDGKKVLDIAGDDLSRQNNGQYYLEGFVVQFKAGAREKNGQVVIGAGHIQLVLRSADDSESLALQPLAMFSQAKGESLQMGRWRFDGKDVFLASAGGAADPVMGFEFMVPRRSANPWQPVALYIRGVRFELTDPYTEQPIKPFAEYGSASEYTLAIDSNTIVDEVTRAVASMSREEAGRFNTTNITGLNSPLKVTNILPGVVLNKGDIRSIDIDDQNRIVGGKSRFERKNLLARGSERSLEVRSFLPGPNTVIVQVDVSPKLGNDDNPFSLLGPVSDEATGAPVLMDNLNQRYEAIGYVYEEQNAVEVAFAPGSPITDKNQLPSLSRARTDQKLTLIFRVSLNVSVTGYAIGTKVVQELTPPKKLDQAQR